MSSYSPDGGTDIWVQNSQSHLSCVLKKALYRAECPKGNANSSNRKHFLDHSSKTDREISPCHQEGGWETRNKASNSLLPSSKRQSFCLPEGKSQELLSPASRLNTWSWLPCVHCSGATDPMTSLLGRTPSFLSGHSLSCSQGRLNTTL